MDNSNSKTHKNTTLTFQLLLKKILSKIFGLTSLEFPSSQNSESIYPNLHGQCY